MAVIGIDLGGTKIAAALFLDSCEMQKKIVRLLDGAIGEAVGKLMIETIDELNKLYETYLDKAIIQLETILKYLKY